MAKENETEAPTPTGWDDFVKSQPNFPTIMRKWIFLAENLVSHTPIDTVDDLGFLIHVCVSATIIDLNDLLILSHAKSRSGAPKLLRSIYERTVTIKYLAENPKEVSKFIGYQAIDWQQVIAECQAKLGGKGSISNLENAAESARKEYKGEVCPQCGLRKQTNWTPKSVKQLASSVGLAHMHGHAYVFPSKSMHPTFYGLMDFLQGPAPLYNVLNCAHELLVHNVLIYRRQCAKRGQVTPMMESAIEDYLKIWTYSEISFDGLLTERKPGVYTVPIKKRVQTWHPAPVHSQ